MSTSLTNSISIKRTERIFNTSYALSKLPHLHRAYVIGGCISFWLAVIMIDSDTSKFHYIFQVYDPGGSYLQFSSFDVENRQRVKCVSAQHGVSFAITQKVEIK